MKDLSCCFYELAERAESQMWSPEMGKKQDYDQGLWLGQVLQQVWTWFRLQRVGVQLWEGNINASQFLIFPWMFCALVNMQILIQEVLRRALKFGISNKLPGGADATGLWTTLGV